MKDITKKSIKKDLEIIIDLGRKYADVIYEPQKGQPAHFDNQTKLCKSCISDIRCGLYIAKIALVTLNKIDILED